MKKMVAENRIGIIGGSGVYKLLDRPKTVRVSTPYGRPSDSVSLGVISGEKVAFLPRHGRRHTIPPHRINYRANIEALRRVGVKKIISAGAVGSLKKKIAPGDIVITDQFIDRTHGRLDTFFSGPKVFHLPAAGVYCENLLRRLAVRQSGCLNLRCHDGGTIVVINGPRFSSRAESRWYKKMGWDTVSMTQYPENVLAAELGICYCHVGLVTDYDAGLEGEAGIAPVTWEQIAKVLDKNADKFQRLVSGMIKSLPEITDRKCAQCHRK